MMKVVFNGVEGFCEVQLNQNNLLSGLVTLMNKFKSPGQTILDGSRLDESILVFMNQGQDDRL
jgi:hypothetical protein